MSDHSRIIPSLKESVDMILDKTSGFHSPSPVHSDLHPTVSLPSFSSPSPPFSLIPFHPFPLDDFTQWPIHMTCSHFSQKNFTCRFTSENSYSWWPPGTSYSWWLTGWCWVFLWDVMMPSHPHRMNDSWNHLISLYIYIHIWFPPVSFQVCKSTGFRFKDFPGTTSVEFQFWSLVKHSAQTFANRIKYFYFEYLQSFRVFVDAARAGWVDVM